MVIQARERRYIGVCVRERGGRERERERERGRERERKGGGGGE